MTNQWFNSDPQFLAAFGQAIRDRREELHLDRKELAAAAGISYSYLSAIESGHKLPSQSVQAAVAEALGTNPSDLLAAANGVVGEEISSTEPAALRIERSEAPQAARLSSFRMDEPMYRRMGHTSDPVSARGAAEELNALLARMDSDDVALLLSMARRMSSRSSGRGNLRDELRRREERMYRGSTGQGLRTEAYLDFWTRYLEEVERRGHEWASGRRPEPRSYFTTPSRIKGASYSASFARNRLLRHELYINRGSREANTELLRRLEADRSAIEAAYGGVLDFEDPGRERRAVRVAEYRDGHISRTDEFDDYVTWFVDRGERLRRALRDHV